MAIQWGEYELFSKIGDRKSVLARLVVVLMANTTPSGDYVPPKVISRPVDYEEAKKSMGFRAIEKRSMKVSMVRPENATHHRIRP